VLSKKSSGQGGGRGAFVNGMEGVKEENWHNKDKSGTH